MKKISWMDGVKKECYGKEYSENNTDNEDKQDWSHCVETSVENTLLKERKKERKK